MSFKMSNYKCFCQTNTFVESGWLGSEVTTTLWNAPQAIRTAQSRSRAATRFGNRQWNNEFCPVCPLSLHPHANTSCACVRANMWACPLAQSKSRVDSKNLTCVGNSKTLVSDIPFVLYPSLPCRILPHVYSCPLLDKIAQCCIDITTFSIPPPMFNLWLTCLGRFTKALYFNPVAHWL